MIKSWLYKLALVLYSYQWVFTFGGIVFFLAIIYAFTMLSLAQQSSVLVPFLLGFLWSMMMNLIIIAFQPISQCINFDISLYRRIKLKVILFGRILLSGLVVMLSFATIVITLRMLIVWSS